MEDDTSLDNIAMHAPQPDDDDATAKFAAQWQPDDTTRLQPAHLPIARVQRAWERKPLSPLSRRKVRVGKVWKRGATTREPSEGVGPGARWLRGGGEVQSPGRAVKKVRLEVGLDVSRWEARGSPGARKIVTRSQDAREALVELGDADAEGEMGLRGDENAAVYEVVDEGGEVVGLARQDAGAEREWMDVEESCDSTVEASPLPPTIEVRPDVRPSPSQPLRIEASEEVITSISSSSGRGADDQLSDAPQSSEEALVIPPLVAPLRPGPAKRVDLTVAALPATQPIALPEGFVSPVKQRRKLGPRSSRLVSESRRKTLPVLFAPVVPAAGHQDTVVGSPADVKDIAMDTEDDAPLVDEIAEHGRLPPAGDCLEHSARGADRLAAAAADEDEWENVDDEKDGNEFASAEVVHESLEEPMVGGEEAPAQAALGSVEEARLGSPDQPNALHEQSQAGLDPTASCRGDPSRHNAVSDWDAVASSPVASIEGPHPRLPLRRSPRRNSSSPLKQRPSTSAPEKPHHLAFTPLRRFSPFVDPRAVPTGSPLGHQDGTMGNTPLARQPTPSPFQRAASAPPEEPQISPRKTIKPRISDDTALLQAFLNRAAESKSSRRLSATEKESLCNRRDSDTIRQALASPARPDVLMEMDPNSPAPWAQQTITAGAESTDGMPAHDSATAISANDTEAMEGIEESTADDNANGTHARRS
ncbi:hypothetical protein LTR53_016949, partial [Teratosphaeriaceae sp. CCFEE 6253]